MANPGTTPTGLSRRPKHLVGFNEDRRFYAYSPDEFKELLGLPMLAANMNQLSADVVQMRSMSGIPGPKGDTGAQGPAGATGPAGAGVTTLGVVTLTETATLSISAGIRIVTVTLTGAAVGDRIVLTPKDPVPAGYAVHNAYVSAANTLKVSLTAPLLAIGAGYLFQMNAVKL